MDELIYRVKIQGDTSNLDKALKMASGKMQKLADDELLIKLNYDGNLKELQKVYKNILKNFPDIPLNFQYEGLKQALDIEKKRLEEMSLSLDGSKLKKQLEDVVAEYIKMSNMDVSGDILDKQEEKISKLYNSIMNLSNGEEIISSLGKEIQKQLSVVDEDIEPLELISDKQYKDQINKINMIQDAMDHLESNGATGFGANANDEDIRALTERVEILEKDISDMKLELNGLSGDKFNEMSSAVKVLENELSNTLNTIKELSKANINPENITFHVGELGADKNRWKSEGFHRMIQNMNIGGFDEGDLGYGILGTGIYHTDWAEDLEIGGENHTGYALNIDPNKYKLLKAQTEAQADKILEFLSRLQGFVVAEGSGYTEWEDTLKDINVDSLFEMYTKSFDDISLDVNGFKNFVERMVSEVQRASAHGIKDEQFVDLPKEFDHADNIVTRFLKEQGYEGIDLRNIKKYNSYEQGSTIFDLHPEDIIETFSSEEAFRQYYESHLKVLSDFQSSKDQISENYHQLIKEVRQDVENLNKQIEDLFKSMSKLNDLNAAEQLVESAESVTASAQDSHSPSKVAENLGEMWGQGYADGILKNKDDVAKAASELVESASNITDGNQTSLSSGIESEVEKTKISLSGLKHYTDEIFDEFDDKLFGSGIGENRLGKGAYFFDKSQSDWWKDIGEDSKYLTTWSANEISLFDQTVGFTEKEIKAIFDKFYSDLSIYDSFDDFEWDMKNILPGMNLEEEFKNQFGFDLQEIVQSIGYDSVKTSAGEYVFYDTSKLIREAEVFDNVAKKIIDTRTEVNSQPNKSDISTSVQELTNEEHILQEVIQAEEKVGIQTKENSLTMQAYIDAEIASLGLLIIKINEVIERIDNKTDAFHSEMVDVQSYVNTEIESLKQLQNAIENISYAITEIPKIELSLDKDVINVDDIESIKKSINDISSESIKELNDSLNLLSNDSKFEKGINNVADAITNLSEKLESIGKNESPLLKQINDIISKESALKDLVKTLSNDKKKIESVKNNVDKKSNNDSTDKKQKEIDHLYWQNRFKESIDNMTAPNKELQEMSKYYAEEAKEAEAQAKKIQNISEKNKSLYNKINLDIDTLSANKDVVANVSEYEKRLKTILELKNKIAQSDFINQEDIGDLKQLKQLVDDLKNDKSFKIGNTTKAASVLKDMQGYLSTNQKLTDEWKDSIRSLMNELEGFNGTTSDLKRIQESFLQIQREAKAADKEGKSFGQDISNQFKHLWAQGIAQFVGIYDIINYVRELTDAIREVDDAMIELKKVSSASGSAIQASLEVSKNTAKDLGATLSDTINATADWSRMGYGIEDAEKLARISVLYQNVGDNIDIQTANESLISTLQGFEMNADEAEGIVDRFNEVANNYAIDSAGIGEALKRSAASLHAANTDLSQSVALVTATNEIVQDTDAVGNMWKTVSARIRGAETELQDLGEETDDYVKSTSKMQDLIKGITGVDIMEDENTFKSIYEIVDEIGQVWNDLSDINQASLLEAMAGKLQSNRLAAVFSNIEHLESAYQTAEESAGSAMREQEHFEEGITYSLNRIKANAQDFATSLLDSSTVKGVVDFGNILLTILDKSIDKFGTLGTILPTIAAGFSAIKNQGRGKMLSLNKYALSY